MGRLKEATGAFMHSWRAFGLDTTGPALDAQMTRRNYSSYTRPDRVSYKFCHGDTILSSIYTRIAVDAAALTVRHVKVDENNRYREDVFDGLQNCLSFEANVDQTGRAFFQDVFMSLFDEGCVGIVPVETDTQPLLRGAGSIEILQLRVGKITEWFPTYVKMQLFNQWTGRKEEVMLPKSMVAIVENPFYAVMNVRNGTVNRLNRKLALMDRDDEGKYTGKLDVILQMPYTVKNELQIQHAEERVKNIEKQLQKSNLGIAYVDATEKITQLNRAVDNGLQEEVEYLVNMLYAQLGLTEEIMNGTAEPNIMINYYNRTIEPLMAAVCDEMTRKFLTKTARTQGHRVKFFNDPFRLATNENIAEMADKLTRNEILSSNEMRGIIGFKPVDDPNADELRNKNLNRADQMLTEKDLFGLSEEDKKPMQPGGLGNNNGNPQKGGSR